MADYLPFTQHVLNALHGTMHAADTAAHALSVTYNQMFVVCLCAQAGERTLDPVSSFSLVFSHFTTELQVTIKYCLRHSPQSGNKKDLDGERGRVIKRFAREY
jgi:hypothetical protein